jgi:glucosamine--fructose-6-phosphate aminotransferase (isomerizing)
MCGIFGCIKTSHDNINISETIITALNLLKNRGYDSCGVYLESKNNMFIYKLGVDGETIKYSNNKDIFVLLEEQILLNNSNDYFKGMGHTRWATHGIKSDNNSHPHQSYDKMITLVHNGIISNCNELKSKYLYDYKFYSDTDTEVIANMIQYLVSKYIDDDFHMILNKLSYIMEGTWACIISRKNDDMLYFLKNETPLLLGKNKDIAMMVSEPSGFLNNVEYYMLLKDKTYGYVDTLGNVVIYGDYDIIKLNKTESQDIVLPKEYDHWMMKEIYDNKNLNVLIDPITNNLRYNDSYVELDLDIIKNHKYLFIIGCGSSYYAGLLASNYFRYTKAFEFVNVFDGGEFNKIHLESIENPEENLLILLISQSGETRDLNIVTTICREFSPNIMLIGIINVVGSLISRRTNNNFYTNTGRENAVASTKSCTSQILACMMLSIYKSELNNKLEFSIKSSFCSDMDRLKQDISNVIDMNNIIKEIAIKIKDSTDLFILGKDELHASALEGALKIKEIAYIHAEGFHLSALKHGPYALIQKGTPIILIYKSYDHFVKSIIEEVKTRGAIVYTISYDTNQHDNSITLPYNKTFNGLLAVISLQLLAYNLSILKEINPDQPRNLAKVVTVD